MGRRVVVHNYLPAPTLDAKPAREMSRADIEAELAGGGFGSGMSAERRAALKTVLSEKKTRGEDALPDGVARDVARWKAKIQELKHDQVRYKDDPAEVRAIKKDIADLERMISDAQNMYR